MKKSLLSVATFLSLVAVSQVSQPAMSQSVGEANAFCIVNGNGHRFRDACMFDQYGGNGSFRIEASAGRIGGRAPIESISVNITEPDVAQVRGMKTDGFSSRWGEAKRSYSDPACWDGSDFSICVYSL